MIRIGHITFEYIPLVLAPMESVTDTAFRAVCKAYGADLMFTEFIASEGLIRNAGKSLAKLRLTDAERPLGIQIFGHSIETMVAAAAIAEQARPDLIDLNFGCPVRKVVSKGGGAALLRDVPRMLEMIRAVVRASHLPVTVKTRLGWDENSKNIVTVAERLQDAGISALTIHARTAVQKYRGKADWTLIGEVKNNPAMKIPVIGNGDIDGPVKAAEVIDRYGVDGIMIGRAATGNPWLFKQIRYYLDNGDLLPPPGISERVGVCRLHIAKAIAAKGERRAVMEMRKFYGNYFKELPDFKKYRMRLMQCIDQEEVMAVLGEIEKAYPGN
jgi:tRNA-dihydrouridine synthase B